METPSSLIHKYSNSGIGTPIEEHRKFQKRVAKLIYWWYDHVIDERDQIIASIVKYRKTRAFVTKLHVLYNATCEIELMPLDSVTDLGNGAGNRITIKF